MTQRYLPNRSLSFEERLNMAGLSINSNQEFSYRQPTHSLIRKYTQQLLEDGKRQNQAQNYENVEGCINELGTKSPTRKKNNLD